MAFFHKKKGEEMKKPLAIKVKVDKRDVFALGDSKSFDDRVFFGLSLPTGNVKVLNKKVFDKALAETNRALKTEVDRIKKSTKVG